LTCSPGTASTVSSALRVRGCGRPPAVTYSRHSRRAQHRFGEIGLVPTAALRTYGVTVRGTARSAWEVK